MATFSVDALNNHMFIIQTKFPECRLECALTDIGQNIPLNAEKNKFSCNLEVSISKPTCRFALTNVHLGFKDIQSSEVNVETVKYSYNGKLLDIPHPHTYQKGWTIDQRIRTKYCRSCHRCEDQYPNVFFIIEFTPPSVVKNLASYLDKGTGSDIEFVIYGEKIAAHSQIVQIVAASSPVLAAILKNNDKEKATKIVPIEGTSAATFRQFLRHLYTGVSLPMYQKERHKKEMTEGLFHLAHKYAVDSLKEQCTTGLIDCLDVDNAIRLLMLGHQYSSEELIKAALSFIAEEGQAICNLSGWLSRRA